LKRRVDGTDRKTIDRPVQARNEEKAIGSGKP